MATVANTLATAFIEFAVWRGAPRRALLAAARLRLEDLSDANGRMGLEQYIGLVRAAKVACADSALPLRFGAASDASSLPLAALVGAAAPTLAEGMVAMNRYIRLTVDVNARTQARFELRSTRDAVLIVDHRLHANDHPELTEQTFARMASVARGGWPGPSFLQAVRVTHARPAHADSYGEIFGVPVQFGAEENALVTRADWAVHPHPRMPQPVYDILRSHADALLRDLEDATTLRGRVERILMSRLSGGNLGVDAVASSIGISRQTLFRQLRLEGVSYRQVRDDLRCRLARHYLGHGKHSVADVARLVGFADATALSRAFRRWSGTTPGAHRANSN